MPDISTAIGGPSIGALLLIGATVWAESGLLIGLILPGDTLLFTVGFFVAQGKLPLLWTVAVIFVAAVLGDNTGYFFGKKTGARIFHKQVGVFFRKDQLERAQQFYRKHGGKTVLFARIVPYARTLVPILAGISNMSRIRFITFNILGALLWTGVFVSLGYWFGVQVAKQIAHYFVPAIIIGILFAVSPTMLYLIRNPQIRISILQKLRQLGSNKRKL